jgi:hypothetical protein
MASSGIDVNHQHEIMTLEEVAQFIRKSKSWVYKNWRSLGGRKLGGSLIFPGKENLYERLFGKGQGMEVRLHPAKKETCVSLFQNQVRGQTGIGHKKGGTEKSTTGGGDHNRHGLISFGK